MQHELFKILFVFYDRIRGLLGTDRSLRHPASRRQGDARIPLRPAAHKSKHNPYLCLKGKSNAFSHMKKILFLTAIMFLFANACKSSGKTTEKPEKQSDYTFIQDTLPPPLPGCYQTDLYFPQLPGKRIAVVANQTSRIGKLHLVDRLLEEHFFVMKVFAPEHGFRGDHDAGEKVENTRDPQTNLPIVSLYGKHRKPTPEDLKNIDVILFDIQDVGARFYTYLSTLHYVLEAAAENNIPVIVLDRPNPHIDEIDGPVLEPAYRSFVGMHPVPILYGMTIGEYARMINGEKWLKNGVQARLTVVPVKYYTRHTPYVLPVKPSPNLPNAQAVALYPSLCLFEPTDISVGRGTPWPFQVYGSPHLPPSEFSFVPQPNAGAKHPKHQGEKCYGKDLRHITPPKGIYLDWILDAYKRHLKKEIFFRKGFERIAGTDALRKQIKSGMSAEEIKKSWQPGLEKFKKIRAKYLIYPE